MRDGRRVEALRLDDAEECTRRQRPRASSREAAAALRRRTVERLMDAGVSFVDPAST